MWLTNQKIEQGFLEKRLNLEVLAVVFQGDGYSASLECSIINY